MVDISSKMKYNVPKQAIHECYTTQTLHYIKIELYHEAHTNHMIVNCKSNCFHAIADPYYTANHYEYKQIRLSSSIRFLKLTGHSNTDVSTCTGRMWFNRDFWY
ncbi:hypothetical protein VCUG_00178 [Vavraia culicis subsp. floridensis]|uniref:Uncharacterized protein n=1 Tax=Vavraia culicis (isolate floridensis) TaxID=948595 RepID=L2GYC2_VAVCU|nr:uncharacterized protein VCUG_00178 [Vavraia culicis subsp. floridensis]ELA48342.1 hypothetical protein VCUG_00178 [Vavraia culicis subsp. floridensis]